MQDDQDLVSRQRLMLVMVRVCLCELVCMLSTCDALIGAMLAAAALLSKPGNA